VTHGKEKQEVVSGVEGRAVARGEVLRRRQRRKAEEQRGFRGRRRGGKSKDWFGIFGKFRGLLVNLEIPTEIEIK
jgi:hypothetical protein